MFQMAIANLLLVNIVKFSCCSHIADFGTSQDLINEYWISTDKTTQCIVLH